MALMDADNSRTFGGLAEILQVTLEGADEKQLEILGEALALYERSYNRTWQLMMKQPATSKLLRAMLAATARA